MPEIKQEKDTRRAFVETLNQINDSKIIVVTPDVGFNYLNDPNNKFKVLNLGVTENSATVIAATLALSGFKVFFYSMINFVLFRPGEFVRNAIVFHKAPVTLLGVKGGSAYKFLGTGHNLLHETEDIDFCKNIGLEAHVPTTNEEVRDTIIKCYQSEKPNYVRL